MAVNTGALQRIVNSIALFYLVLVLSYLAARWLIGDNYWVLSLVNSFAHLLFLPLPILFIAALSVPERIAFMRLLPILAIGIIWLGPRFLPRAVETNYAENGFRVLTGNVLWNNENRAQVDKWLRESQADVICLQEATIAFSTDVLANMLDIFPYQTPITSPTAWSSNVILSRLPTRSREDVDLGIPDTMSIERVVIEFQKQLIAVYCVHLQWPQENRDLAQLAINYHLRVALSFGDSVRNQQIDKLLLLLRSEPLPYVVAGDFNTSDFSVTYGRLASHMRDSFVEAGWGLGSSWPVAKAEGLPEWLPPFLRIDYIWHSDGLRTVRAWQGPPVGSDHLPLFAELAVG